MGAGEFRGVMLLLLVSSELRVFCLVSFPFHSSFLVSSSSVSFSPFLFFPFLSSPFFFLIPLLILLVNSVVFFSQRGFHPLALRSML